MGHVTMIVTTLHGILYYIYWGLTDQYVCTLFLEFGTFLWKCALGS